MAKSSSKPRQGMLFAPQELPWEKAEAAEQPVARVLFPHGPAEPLDYRVPPLLAEKLQVGMRVRVPLGRGDRLREAYCIELLPPTAAAGELKAVAEVVDSRPLLTPALLRLSQWVARRWVCPWATVLEAMIPAGVRLGAGQRWVTLLEPNRAELEKLDLASLPRKQRLALEQLLGAEEPLRPEELARLARCTLAPINALRKKKLVLARRSRVRPRPAGAETPLPARTPPPQLTPEQQQALEPILRALEQRRHEVFLLHGITGSGKTEIYLQAIQQVVQAGRSAIVLVPEISLTPQTQQRFEARFGRVAVLHSHLTDTQRSWHWEQIARGQVSVVVGARSAVFAPVRHLGLVVVDEEHEASFKQESAPRYHAREVALFRAREEGVPVVLGSATPSLESYHRAQSGQYRLLRLAQRINRLPLPQVELIDLRSPAPGRSGPAMISPQLHRAIHQVLEEGGQVILLLNRRGYSTHVQCPACGFAMQCPRCEISLTYHRQDAVVLCHWCDYELPAPRTCPECKHPAIRFWGWGTQRLEEEVRRRFPEHPCLRMDTDAMRRPDSHRRALAAFEQGKVRILLGTQMIAKGLDFPNVHLVGVINADTALHLPDFRASERTFQLLVQVAGRAGRGRRRGWVLVQSFTPDHAVLQAAAAHDYQRFAQRELQMRRSLGYPPFGHMARVVLRSSWPEKARSWAEELVVRIQQQLQATAVEEQGGRVLGPAPAPLARLRQQYRFHLQVLVPEGVPLWDLVAQALEGFQPPQEVQLAVDIDPVNML